MRVRRKVHYSGGPTAALIALLLLFPLVSVTSSAIAAEPVLESAAEPDYPPLSIENPEGQADGFAVELLRAATKAMGREIRFEVRLWGKIKKELASNQLDALPLVGRTPEREDVFDFTVPYLSLFGGIVVRTRDEAIHTADDLRDRKVGVMAGDNAEEYMRREGFTQSLVSTESFSDALRLLSQGQLDAVVVQELVALQLIDELGLDGLEIRARLTGFRQDFCFAVTDGDKELLAILNEGLSRIVANGAYTQLREKWLGSHDPDKIIETDYRLFRQVAIPLLLVLIVILFWNRRLHREIVARRKMERALRESEQQVKDLLDSTAEAIYGLDMHGECIFANPACVRVLGYRNAGELIGRNMHDLIHHKRPDGTPYPTDECPIFRAFLSGNGTHVDTEVLWRADGSSFSAEYWAYPLRRDGEVTGAVVTFLDITERKQAENALISEKQLSEEYINSLPGLFYVFDEERFVRWNREWSRVTGYSDGELASRYGTDFFEGEDRHLIEVRMLKVFRKGLADAEAELVTKDGRKIPYYFTGLRKKIDGKEHLVGLGLDITRRKQSEAEQERLQRELQQAQKMEALGQLTGGIAHDFNNILGIILGNNELALNYCAPDGQTKLARHLNNIHKAGTRAASLVAKMLAYSRSEASDDKPLQLQALVKGDLKMLSSTLPSSIEITTKIEENLPPVLMDQTQLSQLLMNLCVNAQDAMEGKGGLTIRLEWVRELDVECAACHKHVEGDWVVLSVADTGSGIPLEVQECIFDPFFTTKEVGKGTGLGMAVIHGIMRNHGGHVLMKTEQGKGTAFRLLFPPVVEEAETQETDPSSIELLLGQGEHILVVDDEPDLSEFIGDLLESHGYQSTVLTSSKKALKLFKKKPNDFALVITDQTMPGITGKVLVKGLREIRPDIPVILNTGFSEDIDEGSAAEMGIRYLEKPVRAKSLIQAVGELLRPMEPGTE